MSLFNFRNTSASTTNSNAPATSAKMASPAAFQFYTILCTEKGEAITLNTTVTQTELQTEVERLKKLPNFRPISESQISRITGRCNEMGMGYPTSLGTMSMSKASDFIAMLDEKYVKLGFDKRITLKQVEFIHKMSLCPEIPVFTLFLPIDYLDKADQLQTEYSIIMHNMNVGKATEADLAEKEAEMRIFEGECKSISDEGDVSKVDRETASEFIQFHQKAYYAWFNSRCSEGKRSLLKMLFERTGQAMDDAALMQFDNAMADAMIAQLQKEMGATYPSTLEPLAKELMPMPKTIEMAADKAEDDLHALIHSLYACMGDTADDKTLVNCTFKDIYELCKLLNGFFVEESNLIDLLSTCFTSEQIEKLLAK